MFQNNCREDFIDQAHPIPVIVGVGRSGTTLLRLMLDSHPELAIPPETHFIPRLLALSSVGGQLREEFYCKVTESQTWPDFHINKDEFLEALQNLESFSVASGLRCFYGLYAKRFNKKRWGDKTPLYNLHMKDIQECLPNARFIHIVRDGRDVAVSGKDLWFGPGDNIEKQAINWLSRIREARQQSQYLSHYLEIRYEDLVTDTTNTLKNICEFIELPFNCQMEDYYKNASARMDEISARKNSDGSTRVSKESLLSIHANTSSQPDNTRMGRWREGMSDEDQALFNAIAGDLLRDFGYET